LLVRAPNDIVKKFKDSDKRFRMWMELESNWGLSEDMCDNLRQFEDVAKNVADILSIFRQEAERETLLIPDTNSLLVNCDPVAYRNIAPQKTFTFLLLPSIMGELDKLKYLHRNQDVREKAEKAIKRIKGWRNQGSLMDGVVVDKTINVRAWHKEPDMNNTLSWLDGAIQDDRIIASVLLAQAENTSAVVYLVTGDINLQNKADAAFISVLEVA
jgi:predicted ribonuclease YlaK